MSNELLGGRYEILDKIGGGGMAIVYLARDTFLDRYVAVKVLRDEFIENEEFISRFHKEAKAVAALNHPNIVNIYDFASDASPIYLVMEFVEGKTLKQLLNEKGHLSNQEALDIAYQIASGLSEAHKVHIIHKDVKSQNILIDKNGGVKITDFGIAQILSNATITHHRGVLGSAHYFSPEQARGEQVDYRTDIYSLGIVLYEMLTGTVPFTGDNPVTVALKHIQELPKPPSELNSDITPEIEAVVLKCLEKRRENRYQTIDELQSELFKLKEHDYQPIDESSNAYIAAPAYKPQPHVEDELDSTLALPKDFTQKHISLDNNEAKKQKVKSKDRKKKSPVMIALLIVLASLATIFILRTFIFSGNIVVPDVVNMPYEEAETVLTEQNLKIEEDKREYDDEVPKDHIIKQSPESGSKVRSGRTIAVVVSDGPEPVEVPDLEGMTESQAKKALKKAGLELAGIEKGYSSEFKEGTVYSQAPEAGTEIKKGEEVLLYISLGEEEETVLMPDVRGQSLSSARSILANLELTVGDVSEESSNNVAKGLVISQGYDPNTSLYKGTVVNIVISSGPSQDKTTQFQLSMPESGYLVVEVSDGNGSRMILSGNYNQGDYISDSYTYSGSGTIRATVNGNVVLEENLN